MNAETLKGHLDMLLLAAVRPEAAHGYAIAERLRARSSGAFDLPKAPCIQPCIGSNVVVC
jgi:DNA-binding PadR family transcriptional regulator